MRAGRRLRAALKGLSRTVSGKACYGSNSAGHAPKDLDAFAQRRCVALIDDKGGTAPLHFAQVDAPAPD